MRFSEVLQSLQAQADEWTAMVSDDWLQGRSLFGGLQVALMLQPMRALLPAVMPLRSLQATFLAPVPAGPQRIRAQLLRTGKNTAHVEARLLSGAQALCSVLAVFGQARDSQVRRQPLPMAVPTGVAPVQPSAPQLLPSFLQHFGVRWLHGALPFSGVATPQAVLEVDVRDHGPITEEHVVAIADVPPPLALSQLRAPAPGSSLNWMLEFLPTALPSLALQGWRLDAALTAGGEGYTSQDVTVWGPGGTPVALGRQTMVVFA